jgi:hypothetical protein
VQWTPAFTVDEWFHPGRPSRIISVCATLNGETDSEMEIHSDEPFAIHGCLDKLCLNPDDRAVCAAQGEVVRRISDAHIMQVTQPTPNPRVSVHAPEGIDYRVSFSNREQEQVRHVGPHTDELPGTLLPGQFIEVRWWPVDAESGDEGHGASADESAQPDEDGQVSVKAGRDQARSGGAEPTHASG